MSQNNVVSCYCSWFPPELDDMSLFLQMPYLLELAKRGLHPARERSYWWKVLGRVFRVKSPQSSYLAENSTIYENNLLSKLHLHVQYWHNCYRCKQSLPDWIWGLLQRNQFIPVIQKGPSSKVLGSGGQTT